MGGDPVFLELFALVQQNGGVHFERGQWVDVFEKRFPWRCVLLEPSQLVPRCAVQGLGDSPSSAAHALLIHIYTSRRDLLGR